MKNREAIRNELSSLFDTEGDSINAYLEKDEYIEFCLSYQDWYTRALSAVALLAPDRLEEFRNYYDGSREKRKEITPNTYSIKDYIDQVGVSTRHGFTEEMRKAKAAVAFFQQRALLRSVAIHMDSILANLESELYAEVLDGEIAAARKLSNINLRAAGALAGVAIESHLKKVVKYHGISISKKDPTISDLSEPLKKATIIDTPTWRKITYLADIRNICCHKKAGEPTQSQVRELIDGSEWLIMNVF